MDSKPDSSPQTAEDYEEIVRHMRGDDTIDGNTMMITAIGTVVGIVIGAIGNLVMKNKSETFLAPLTGGVIGSLGGYGIGEYQHQRRMDKKAAEVLFGDRIKKEKDQPANSKSL